MWAILLGSAKRAVHGHVTDSNRQRHLSRLSRLQLTTIVNLPAEESYRAIVPEPVLNPRGMSEPNWGSSHEALIYLFSHNEPTCALRCSSCKEAHRYVSCRVNCACGLINAGEDAGLGLVRHRACRQRQRARCLPPQQGRVQQAFPPSVSTALTHHESTRNALLTLVAAGPSPALVTLPLLSSPRGLHPLRGVSVGSRWAVDAVSMVPPHVESPSRRAQLREDWLAVALTIAGCSVAC